MKTIDIKQLDERSEEITDTLISLGMSRNVARTLSYLKSVDEATSIDLERGAELRQPEVSIAMGELKKHDWVNEREEKNPGKGRPYRIYSLKIDFDEVIAHLERKHRKAVNETLLKIEKLKKLEKDA